MAKQGLARGSVGGMRCGSDSHGIPRFFHTCWWIFHRCLLCEGDVFLYNKAYRLNELEAFRLLRSLDETHLAVVIYCDRLASLDGPFEAGLSKWKPSSGRCAKARRTKMRDLTLAIIQELLTGRIRLK